MPSAKLKSTNGSTNKANGYKFYLNSLAYLAGTFPSGVMHFQKYLDSFLSFYTAFSSANFSLKDNHAVPMFVWSSFRLLMLVLMSKNSFNLLHKCLLNIRKQITLLFSRSCLILLVNGDYKTGFKAVEKFINPL